MASRIRNKVRPDPQVLLDPKGLKGRRDHRVRPDPKASGGPEAIRARWVRKGHRVLKVRPGRQDHPDRGD
jgi:hypothetical protein